MNKWSVCYVRYNITCIVFLLLIMRCPIAFDLRILARLLAEVKITNALTAKELCDNVNEKIRRKLDKEAS